MVPVALPTLRESAVTGTSPGRGVHGIAQHAWDVCYDSPAHPAPEVAACIVLRRLPEGDVVTALIHEELHHVLQHFAERACEWLDVRAPSVAATRAWLGLEAS